MGNLRPFTVFFAIFVMVVFSVIDIYLLFIILPNHGSWYISAWELNLHCSIVWRKQKMTWVNIQSVTSWLYGSHLQWDVLCMDVTFICRAPKHWIFVYIYIDRSIYIYVASWGNHCIVSIGYYCHSQTKVVFSDISCSSCDLFHLHIHNEGIYMTNSLGNKYLGYQISFN